jgi:SAM-dependent methyltransferase
VGADPPDPPEPDPPEQPDPSDPPEPTRSLPVPDRLRRPLRTAVVWDQLSRALDAHVRAAGREQLDLLDAGGGTGGFAVPLAELGHRVTVVDPSPDALAALERRAAEQGVTDLVRAVQGDAGGLLEVASPGSVDVVLVHGVLEYVEDPQAALTATATVLRPGGLASVLVAQRLAVVLARALSGRFAEAQHALHDPGGRWGDGDPVPRRFDAAGAGALLAAAGLEVREQAGVRVFTDLVPGALLDAEPRAAEALLALETAVAEHPVLSGVAAALHLIAVSTGEPVADPAVSS